MPRRTRSPINIKKSEEGSLRRIAQREGGIKKNGDISVAWMNRKLKNPRTTEAVRKKLQFAKNARGFKH